MTSSVMDPATSSFPDIFKSLKDLKDLMRCFFCNEHMISPVSLWSCDHVFCETCISTSTTCPKCNLPAWPKDMSKNRQLHSISLLCNQLECSLSETSSSLEINTENKIQQCKTLPSKKVATIQKKRCLKPSKKIDLTIEAVNLKRKKLKVKASADQSVSKLLASSLPKTSSAPKSFQSLQKNVKGETPLHLAAMLGDLNKVEHHLKTKLNVNTKDHAGWTPLHEACNQGHVIIVEKLLDAGALIDIPGYENDTPLIDAVSNSRLSVVELLLQRGANVFLRNSAGKTALDLAQNSKMRSLLLKYIDVSSVDKENDALLKTKPDNIVIAFSSSINMKKIKSLCNVLGASISQHNALGCSHYIVSYSDEFKTVRSLKYLQAMAAGASILSEKWIEKCLDSKDWVNESNFQIKGCYEDAMLDGPMLSRKAKLKCLPRLFDGCHFFLYGRFASPLPTKQQLIEVIKEAGGLILNREPKPDNDIVQSCQKVPYHACPDKPQYYFTYYIVYDFSQKFSPRLVRLGKVCTVSASWILDCISQFRICDIV